MPGKQIYRYREMKGGTKNCHSKQEVQQLPSGHQFQPLCLLLASSTVFYTTMTGMAVVEHTAAGHMSCH